jgi:hypothetical protein
MPYDLCSMINLVTIGLCQQSTRFGNVPSTLRLTGEQSKSSRSSLKIDRLVHREFVPPGHSVTGHFYVPVLQRLRAAVRRKRRDKLQAGTVV